MPVARMCTHPLPSLGLSSPPASIQQHEHMSPSAAMQLIVLWKAVHILVVPHYMHLTQRNISGSDRTSLGYRIALRLGDVFSEFARYLERLRGSAAPGSTFR